MHVWVKLILFSIVLKLDPADSGLESSRVEEKIREKKPDVTRLTRRVDPSNPAVNISIP
jgi:hypothetical protein